MSSIGFFDSNTVAPSSGNDPIPVGVYTMALTASEVKDTKAGTGKYISFEWTVVDGEHKGRKVWQIVNFMNPSAKAQQIGQAELSAICRACKKTAIRDTGELHNIPVQVKVGTEKNQNGDDRNCVKSVLWKESAAAGAGSTAATAEPVQVPVSDDDLPDFLK